MNTYKLGIDIGSTTVKIAILDENNQILFSDYERHFANIQETLQQLLEKAVDKLGTFHVHPVITGSGGLTLATHLNVPFTQEVVAVSTALQDYAPQCDVAIELGGEDAKIIYFTNGVDQRMNGICAGGTGSFIMNMPRIISPFIRLPPAAVYLQSRISSRLSMKGQQRKTYLLLFFRRLSTRQSAVLPAVNRFAETLLS